MTTSITERDNHLYVSTEEHIITPESVLPKTKAKTKQHKKETNKNANKPESDQASRSNYQFIGNKRTEQYVNNTWGGNHQIRMNKIPGFSKK